MKNKSQSEMLVKKASGELEPFSEAKLRQSLTRAKTSPENIERIVSHISKELKTGITTHEIYKHAFSLLSKYELPTAGRYSIKQAIMDLGPTGHPFEKLVGELLKTDGYQVRVGQIVQGNCIAHEVDVVAEKEDKHLMVECKFHNRPGTKSDVKVTLYVQARFEDVQKAWIKTKDHLQRFHEAWLVTNTKLTSDAVRYAECVGMRAVGWNYPAQESLAVLIDRSGLHPITCLSTLDLSNKKQLLSKGVVMCKELLENRDLLKNLGFSSEKLRQVEQEMGDLCKTI